MEPSECRAGAGRPAATREEVASVGAGGWGTGTRSVANPATEVGRRLATVEIRPASEASAAGDLPGLLSPGRHFRPSAAVARSAAAHAAAFDDDDGRSGWCQFCCG